MRYAYLIAFAMLMAMPTVSTLADEPTADQRLRPHRKIRPGVFSESGLARFRLLGGRIDVDPMRYRKGSVELTTGDFTESITVSSSSGIPLVHYSFRDGFQRVQLVAEHGKSLRIESTILATGEQAILEQRVGGQIHWSTRRDPSSTSKLDQHLTGPTLLHIVGQDEAGFQIHVETLLSRMLQGRSLIELTQRTERYLRNHSHELFFVSSDQVNRWIDQLRSPKSAKRRAATIKLTRFGTSAIPFLSAALERNDLDAEQRSRIETLITRCPRIDEDTPSSLACLLSTDREHWQIMAQRMNQTEWIAANDHIRRCGLELLTR